MLLVTFMATENETYAHYTVQGADLGRGETKFLFHKIHTLAKHV